MQDHTSRIFVILSNGTVHISVPRPSWFTESSGQKVRNHRLSKYLQSSAHTVSGMISICNLSVAEHEWANKPDDTYDSCGYNPVVQTPVSAQTGHAGDSS
jgi:hypothetical protein